MPNDELESFEGGATRSVKEIDLTLLSKSAILALGKRHTLGALKHGRNNWRKGGEKFRLATITHLLEHVLDYIENGNTNDDNTGAIICNAAFLCDYEERMPFKPQELTNVQTQE